MSGIFFTQTISVERLGNSTGSTIKEEYKSQSTIYGVVMNLRPEDAFLSEGNPAKSAILYCKLDSDVKDGDRITYNGVKYIVKGVEGSSLFGRSISFKKAIVEQMNS
jgi:hypothetical protein